jgi:hypothetical protein
LPLSAEERTEKKESWYSLALEEAGQDLNLSPSVAGADSPAQHFRISHRCKAIKSEKMETRFCEFQFDTDMTARWSVTLLRH